jgi:hypothetical protein
MTLKSVRQIFTVLLAVLLTAGLSLTAAQAGNMPMKMHMAAAGHSGCHDCVGCDAGKAKAMICASICAASVLATLPQAPPMVVAEIVTTLALPEDEFLVGSMSPPDPYPPRSADIG